ncbi:MAG: hypothetical protein LBV31_03300, partial [Prevotellaceae bacterium]|nr:hypothetical protein [Prevotellaceae bacterium]
MRKISTFLLMLVMGASSAYALDGDTTVVQAFSFANGHLASWTNQRDTVEFPDGSTQYEKILMYYTLKCDPTQNPACGEWDYIFDTKLFEQIGTDDQTSEPVYRTWKLGTYITPYGYGINLGNGWTWVYDVSDFAHLLQGTKIIEDGNFQELLDLKFIFIEGTPPRNLIDLQQIYQGDYQLSTFDQTVKDTTVTLNPAAQYAKLRTTVTGHGFDNPENCAEFCPNIHSIKSNGQTVYSWNIIQECAENPLYPQGGTWIYDRAGWCPGMKGTTYEFDMTNYISNGALNFDYNIQQKSDGNYRTAIYLATYGAINHQADVSAEDIIAPTNNPFQLRYNPTCGQPIVVIKNIGADILNTLEIQYGFGDSIYTFNWSGELAFMQLDTVVLPLPDWNEVQGQTGTFTYTLLNPNGQTDPTPYNNAQSSHFSTPLKLSVNALGFYFKTNKSPAETTWKLYDVQGNVLFQNGTMAANTVYSTSMPLANGSYKLALYDAGNDGFDFWANNDGTGIAQIRKDG